MKLSVITPSLNQGMFIERTIKSVLAQNVENLEYLVVDGDSQDQTLEILSRYNSQLQFISEPDQGQSNAINKGLKMTTGEIVGWLNSDDVYYPGSLQLVCEYFDQHPEVDVVYGLANHIDAEDNLLSPYPTEEWNFKRLLKNCYLSQPAVFLRRSVFEKYGLLEENLNYCMDYEYWLRLGRQGASFAYIPHLLAGSRLHENTKTTSQAVAMQQEVIGMLKQRFHKVHSRWFLSYGFAWAKTKMRLVNVLFPVMFLGKAGQMALEINGFRGGLKSIVFFPGVLAMLLLRRFTSHPG